MMNTTFNQIIEGSQIEIANPIMKGIISNEGIATSTLPQPEYTSEYLLYNWEESVPAFLAWVEQFDVPDAYDIFKSMITTKEKLDSFIKNIFNGNFSDLYDNAIRLLKANNWSFN